MKTIKIIIIIILSISCKAQTIVPVENLHLYQDEENADFQEGKYFKDINGKLAKFYGHWQATATDGKVLDFYITPYLKTNTNTTYDKIRIRYTIKDQNGNILADTTTLPEDDSEVIDRGFFGSNEATYQISYMGFEGGCGQNGNLFLAVVGLGDSQMNYYYSVYGEILSDNCPPGGVDQVMPMEQLTFTKDPIDVIED
ncbi:hypothetical protein GCM10009117_06830 [Gangjinia marincola]|uniref:Uncharacterized protein n=1 Tax=Gangjinia marincola TaxID=578463 RepID=A0ABN1MEN9_9FLAO